ncbi:SdpI family protein [Leptolinea tardivitalis]|uniref:DUF1648 domain-containing protein n=1 Tax=Leptolinea tardivitalis TaxID=229920 RepID=A0A0P6XKP5_9CHLR|nr:SdpI family protein [Leptolinea tardivitalis]KPL72148.1 hypothetical protein ADM99_08380 [Leptolinea tardivitalis]GAP20617.1 predicted integral membrane protein [Leptolinea tardivitalis]
MKTKTVFFGVIALGLILIITGYFLAPQMGTRLASHWNARGEADGYSSSFAGLYFLPLFTIGMALILIFIPEIDPLKTNVQKFRKEYNLFIGSFSLFMYYIHSLTLAWNMGLKFSMNALMIPGIGVFFIAVGLMIRKAKRNYFIGIRTPWTLNNDEVWDKTHDLGGKLFMASGVLTIASIIYPDTAIVVLLVTALLSTAICIVYSYLEFRKIQNTVL